jgi:hypothetical protein
MNYKCELCDRSFEYNSELQSHLACCEFFYKKHKVRLIRSKEDAAISNSNLADNGETAVDRIPVDTGITVRSLYELVIRQGKEIETLKQDITKLKNNQSARVSRAVKTKFAEDNGVSIRFEDWVKTIVVSDLHLNEVFKYSKIDGLKSSIKDALDNCKDGVCPIKACSQRTSSVYIYTILKTTTTEKENKKEKEEFNASSVTEIPVNSGKCGWVRMTNENIHCMIVHITRGLMLRHLEYQIENKNLIDSNETEREKSFLCIKKLNNMYISLDKQKAELKKWLISYVICV